MGLDRDTVYVFTSYKLSNCTSVFEQILPSAFAHDIKFEDSPSKAQLDYKTNDTSGFSYI